MPELDDPRVPLAHERTDLAYDRNRWAAERTLLAWIRTSLAMVSLGFAIDKFFAFLQQQDGDVALGQSYHWLGLCLVFVGTLLLGIATAEHLVILKQLQQRRSFVRPRLSLPLFGAGIVLLLSFAALLLVLFRWPWIGG
jgi:uncharacterized membrane protein YidH (DUF202 family)